MVPPKFPLGAAAQPLLLRQWALLSSHLLFHLSPHISGCAFVQTGIILTVLGSPVLVLVAMGVFGQGKTLLGVCHAGQVGAA